MVRVSILCFRCRSSVDKGRKGRRYQSAEAQRLANLLQKVQSAGPYSYPPLYGRRLKARAIAPSLSVTHSREVIAAARARQGIVGVDVEYIDSRRNIDMIGAAVFGPREQEAVRKFGRLAFYRMWCLREAYAKASGKGIIAVADRIDRFADCVHRDRGSVRIGIRRWFWRIIPLSPQFLLACVHSLPGADSFGPMRRRIYRGATKMDVL